MAGTSPNLGLYLPGGGSTGTYVPDEVADIDPINQNFVKIDTAVGNPANQNRQYYGPASSIGTVVGMKLGDEYQESDVNKVLWRYDGTNWVTNEGGMMLVRPASVANGTIAADGAIVGTAGQVLLVVGGVFSSKYRAYKIIFSVLSSGAASIQFTLRRGGTNLSAVDYKGTRIWASSATPAGVILTTAFWEFAGAIADYHQGEVLLSNPGGAGYKSVVATCISRSAPNLSLSTFGGIVDSAEKNAAVDGFVVNITAPFVASTENYIKVYGMI